MFYVSFDVGKWEHFKIIREENYLALVLKRKHYLVLRMRQLQFKIL